MTAAHRRNDPPGAPVHELDPPVPVRIRFDEATYEGLANRWRGRWVDCTWSSGVGMKHTMWLHADDVERIRT
ncbi:MAG: hypothetical protein JWP14_3361 [Frankiales bacterium]|nr:hypothetical protein [Frankiales bacterium]